MVTGSDFIKLAGYADLVDGLTNLSEDWTPDGVWFVGTPAKYAIYVHDGTSRMEGRPFFTDAIDEVMKKQGDELADAAEDADDLVRKVALSLEAEGKYQIKDVYDAVKSGHMRRTFEAQKL